jgi:benzoate membrane transport protein
VLALAAGLVTAAAAASPPELVATVAGLALLGALAGALRAALASEAHREAAVITFVVSASAITVAGISAPFWGLVAGLVFLAVQRAGARDASEPDEGVEQRARGGLGGGAAGRHQPEASAALE